MTKVLIALDYDPTAQRVAEAGYALAKAMDAQVVLFHVITDPVYYSSVAYGPVMGFGGYIDTDFVQTDVMEGLKKSSLEFLDKSKWYLGDTGIQTLVREGDVADTILDTAKELKADIIVMGSHSRKWLEAIVLGSAAEKVLRHTTVPLYIIPTKGES